MNTAKRAAREARREDRDQAEGVAHLVARSVAYERRLRGHAVEAAKRQATSKRSTKHAGVRCPRAERELARVLPRMFPHLYEWQPSDLLDVDAEA